MSTLALLVSNLLLTAGVMAGILALGSAAIGLAFPCAGQSRGENVDGRSTSAQSAAHLQP